MVVAARTFRNLPTRSCALLGAIAVALVLPTAQASAQGLFDFLFGRRPAAPPAANAYADPYPSFGNPDERRPSGGPSVVFCVRVCDGRYFPMQRNAGASAAQLCNSFCPAAQTRVFSGSAIEHAVANDGSRYASLRTAYAYRERIVEDCTCNGRDAYGLVPVPASDDPTLRPGDIVATNEGFVAYTGSQRSADFTPVQSYPGLPQDMRQRLSETRIVPTNATPVPPRALQEGAAAVPNDRNPNDRNAGERNRRVQLDR